MKKILLIGVAMIFATSMFAQKGLNKNVKLAQNVNVARTQTMVKGNELSVPGENSGNYSPVAKGTRGESDLLKSIYDLQSNSGVSNRAYRMADGTIGFTATLSEEDTHANRGTGYNYFNGSSWNDLVELRNVESIRAGWPTIVPYGAGELIFSHGGSPTEILCHKREVRGEGEWIDMGSLPYTEGDYAWPRAGVTTGEDGTQYVHVVASYQWTDEESVVRTKIKYWRSNDGGSTWGIQEQEIEGFDYASNTRLNSDYITISTNGSSIVMLLVDGGIDVMYVRSDDNGETWSHHYIYQHWFSEEGMEYLDVPMAADDTIELWCPTAGTGVLDPNGKFHAVFNTGSISRYGDGSYYSYGAGVDGISYWNEDMGQIVRDPSFVNNMGNHAATTDSTFHMIAMDRNENLTIIGGMGGTWYGIWSEDAYDEEGNPLWPILASWSNDQILFYRTYGLSTMPTIAVDHLGRILIAFVTTTKEGETGGNYSLYYRRLYARVYDSYLGTWSEETIPLTNDFTYGLSEVVYPIVPNGNVEGNYWDIFYSVDNIPGLLLDTDVPNTQTEGTDNFYRHNTLEKTFHPDAAIEENETISFSMNPNPAKNNVIINVPTTATIEIYNTVGQLVKVINNAQGNVAVDVTSFINGVYLVNVRNNNGVATAQKLIVQ
ncbi:MAG: T9SS type A sorting domain-containing protein [Bacteroidales bacterium]|nr:T9SS type A sorting domain-containing protein [Bacteroidales bacterium]